MANTFTGMTNDDILASLGVTRKPSTSIPPADEGTGRPVSVPYDKGQPGTTSQTEQSEKKSVFEQLTDFVQRGKDNKLSAIEHTADYYKENAEKNPDTRTWLQKGTISDGYKFGDVSKGVAASVGDAAENVGAGILGLGEKFADAATQLGAWSYGGLKQSNPGAAQPSYSFSLEDREKEQEKAKDFISKDLYDEQAISKKVVGAPARWLGIDTEKDSFLGEKTDALAESGGQLLGTAALQAVGVPWFMTTGLSSFGGSLEEAYNEGADFKEAGASAAISAAAEILSEKISGGIKFKGKTLDDVITKKLAETIADKTFNTLAQTGVAAIGEGLEELLSGYVSAIGKKLTYADDKTLAEIFSREEALESFIGGALLGGGIGLINNVRGGDDTQSAAPKAVESPTAEKAEISPSEAVSPQAANVMGENAQTDTAYQGAPGFEAEAEAMGEEAKAPEMRGTGALAADTVETETPYKMADTTDKATTQSNWMPERLKEQAAPEKHRVITEKESMAAWEQVFERGNFGRIENYREVAEMLLEIPNWTGRETDAAMRIARAAAAAGDLETANALIAARRGEMSEAARTLQAQQKWIGESGDNITTAAVETLAKAEEEGSIDAQESSGILQNISELSEEFDAVSDETPVNTIKRKATKEAAEELGDAIAQPKRPKRKSGKPKSREGRNAKGEPFTFEYAEKVGEAVARSLTRSEEPRTFLQQMASVLRRFANEKADKAKQKPMTATEVLRDYVQNWEFYQQAWEAAQWAIRDGKGISPELENFVNSNINFDAKSPEGNGVFMQALVSAAAQSEETRTQIAVQAALGFQNMDGLIADTLIRETGATGEMADTIRTAASYYVRNVLNASKKTSAEIVNAKIKAAMHDIGSTISKTASMSDTAKQDMENELIALLTQKYGFANADARYVADTVREAFNALVKESADSQIKQMLKKAKTPEAKSFLEKLEKATNLGALDSDMFAEDVSQKLLGEGAGAMDANLLHELFDTDKAQGYMDIIRKTAEMRKTAKLRDGNLRKVEEWALKRIAENGDIDFLKTFAANSIANLANDAKKLSPAEAIKTVRRLSMLSKASTTLRNLVSNGVFAPADTFARDISVPLDMLISKFTKTRSIAVDKGIISEAKRKGIADGLAKSILEVGLDVDATAREGAYEQSINRTFKMNAGPVSRLFSTWERLSGYALQTTDSAAKGGTEAEIARGLQALVDSGKLKLPEGMSVEDMAKQEALYRTFQDDSVLSGASLGARELLNKVHVGDVGLGDVAIPFAKTPANLASRALEYSPAGFISSGMEFGKMLRAAKKGELTPAMQAKAVQSVGRAFTGSSLIAFSAWMAANGIIRSLDALPDDEDKDKVALAKAAGQNGTQLNADALIRRLQGGSGEWQDGDTLISISFLEPFNAMLASGAIIAEDLANENANFGELMSGSLEGAWRSIMETPLMNSFSEAYNTYKYAEGDKAVLKFANAAGQYMADQTTSFIPNALKGIAQGTDPYQREMYTSDTVYGQLWDNVRGSIPGLRQTLPTKTDSFGRPMETEGGALGFINANVLPGYVTHYKEQPGASVLDRLYELTGSATAYPDRKAPSKIEFSIDGKKYELEIGGEAAAQYVQTAGEKHMELLEAVEESEDFARLSTEQQQAVVEAVRNQAQTEAKAEAFKDAGMPYEQSAKEQVESRMSAYDYIEWLISGTKQTTPAGYKSGNPDWQNFERAVEVLPPQTALNMMYAYNESAAKKVDKALQMGVSIEDAVAYYRAITQRTAAGKAPTQAEINQRLAVLGLDTQTRSVLAQAFKDEKK